jgi:ribosomal protein L9
VAELTRREAQQARHQARTADEATAIVARLEATELRLEVKAGPTGSLFGSVTATTVADTLWETQKIRIDRRKLELAPIKRIGRYAAPLEVFSGVTAELRLLVVPEGGELPPEATVTPVLEPDEPPTEDAAVDTVAPLEAPAGPLLAPEEPFATAADTDGGPSDEAVEISDDT